MVGDYFVAYESV